MGGVGDDGLGQSETSAWPLVEEVVETGAIAELDLATPSSLTPIDLPQLVRSLAYDLPTQTRLQRLHATQVVALARRLDGLATADRDAISTEDLARALDG